MTDLGLQACPQRQTLIIFFCDEPSRDGDRLGKPYFVDEFNTCVYRVLLPYCCSGVVVLCCCSAVVRIIVVVMC